MRLVKAFLARTLRAYARLCNRVADRLDPLPSQAVGVLAVAHAGRVVLCVDGLDVGISLAPEACRKLRRGLRRAEAEACGLTGLVAELGRDAGAG